MKTILQATGRSPVEIEYIHYVFHIEMTDKRGVAILLYQLVDGSWVSVVKYLTNWGTERPFTYLLKGNLETVAEAVRNIAGSILPPGAGYPAMPQYETRQAKLQGMLETLTLVALSDVLRQVSEGQKND